MQLTRFEREAVRSVFSALFPSGHAGVPGADELDLLPHFSLVLDALPPLKRTGVRAAFVACAVILPLALTGRPRTLASLDPLEREEVLTRLLGHPRYLARQAGLLVKALACLAYFQDPRVRSAFSLPPVADTPPEAAV